ncbi:MAG: helix-hairpin-helix domain-containing protein [Lachnospiraceae bacterium]|nr:helix-hairpin-helix domain-containing protein [Lachnospiraceae bacterium]
MNYPSFQYFLRTIRRLCAVSVLSLSVLCGCGAGEYSYGTDLPGSETSSDEADPEQETPDQNDPGTEKQTSVFVQVCGAVNAPGVYELRSDARVFEAVQMAGGLREDAAYEAVNQAGVLSDGDMIRIPTEEEYEQMQASFTGTDTGQDPTASTGDAADDGKVDLNRADEALLMTLPGIGEGKAKSIIEYRTEHGDFGSIEEIKKVSGIKDGLFQKIKDMIRV